MKRLINKVAIVTGAGNGLGKGICQVFSEEGAWVLVTDIDALAAEKTAAEIKQAGGSAESFKLDISNAAEIEAAVKIVSEKFGRIDILCNNAAYLGQWHDVLHSSKEEWTGCLNTTLLGTHLLTQAVLPWMIPQKCGSIIITSSIQGLVACPDSASYSTAKAGLIGYAKSAACDYGKHNIRVNVIAPGPIAVAYSPKPGDPGHAYQISNTFLRRVGQPREVGCVALFLASNDSSYVTGAVIPVDGGWTAM